MPTAAELAAQGIQIDPRTSPYFTPQDMGSVSGSFGSGAGVGWMRGLENLPGSEAYYTPASGSGVLLKDDPQYGRFFKMLKMGVPPQAVANKVAAEGLDPAVMSRDPEGPSPFA